MNKKTLSVALPVISFVFIILSLKILLNNFTGNGNSNIDDRSSNTNLKIDLTSSQVVDSALSDKVVPRHFEYKEDLKSPFSLLDGKAVRRRSSGKVAKTTVVRKKVFLKGILDKKNALALLEDEKGKTFICKKGDQVYSWTVTEIEDEHVVIRDGKYEEVLKVKGR